MKTSSAFLERWQEHLARPFPHSRPAHEWGPHSAMDLTELDTFISGYLSRIAHGEALASADVQRLEQWSQELSNMLQSLQGDTRTYFAALVEVVNAAEAAGPKQ